MSIDFFAAMNKKLYCLAITATLATSISAQHVKLHFSSDYERSFSHEDVAKIEFTPKPVAEYVSVESGIYYYSYNQADEVLWFRVSPSYVLDYYEPVVTLSNNDITLNTPSLVIEDIESPWIDYKRVGVRFASPRKNGECVITLTVGEGDYAKSASSTIAMYPAVEGSLWDDGHGTGPHDVPIRRPVTGELSMYTTQRVSKTVFTNSDSYIYASVNVPGGNETDIQNAMELCRWEQVTGRTATAYAIRNEIIPGVGFDSKLYVNTGSSPGETTFRFTMPQSYSYDLYARFNVVDYQEVPVDNIDTNIHGNSIELAVGADFNLQATTLPYSSNSLIKMTASAGDPSIVDVRQWQPNKFSITGKKEGPTTVTVTARDKTLTIPVNVTEGVSSITFSGSNPAAIFVGQTVNWTADVTTTSGAANPYAISWQSSDTSVATVARGTNATTEGAVKGVSTGSSTITATVKNKKVSADINVVAIPESTTYTADNIYRPLIANSGNDLRISFYGSQNEYVQIFLAGYKNRYDFDITDMSIVTVIYNGVVLKPSSGWITGIDDGVRTTVTFNMSFTVGTKTFTLTSTGFKD